MKELWDARFSSEEYVYGTAPNAFFAECLPKLKAGKIFLPAEGEGRNAVYAAGLHWEVVAMDFSKEGKEKALKLAQNHNVKIDYSVGDVLENPWCGPFDSIASFFLHLPKMQRKILHHKMIEELKPAGYIILEVFDVENIGMSNMGPKQAELLYTINELHEDFASLNILHCEKSKRKLSEGIFHDEEGITLRFLARKD